MPYKQDGFKTTFIEPEGSNEGRRQRWGFLAAVVAVFACIGSCLLLIGG